jgi:hypothetical protein
LNAEENDMGKPELASFVLLGVVTCTGTGCGGDNHTATGAGGAANGDAQSTGGITSNGGETSAGGAANAGGETTTGGVNSEGGATSMGGSATSAGASATGGTTNAGGTTTTGGVTNATGGTPTGGLAAGGSATAGASGVLAAGLSISKISLFQAVEIPLMVNGEAVVTRKAKIVQNKDALLRIHVVTQSDWAPRAVQAVVDLTSSAGAIAADDTKTIQSDSVDGDLASTFNVHIAGQYLTADAVYRASLVEIAGAGGQPSDAGDSSKARWPEGDMAPLEAKGLGGGLQIVIVPVPYNADGSGRMPVLDDAQIALYRQYFALYYPIPDGDISIVVGDPLSWDYTVYPDGTDWDSLLINVADLKDTRHGTYKQYYFGAIAPAVSRDAYCPSSPCVTGLGFIPTTHGTSAYASSIMASVGVAWGGTSAADTMIHEVGHNHGREHAPCDTSSGLDTNFPYAGGLIGVWGYNPGQDTLMSPETYGDFMGYCKTDWVSDYTYNALFDWIEGTNALPSAETTESVWRSLRIGARGQVSFGPSYSMETPSGIATTVEWLDADLASVGTEVGYHTRLDHLPGGIVLFPEPPATAAFVRVSGIDPVPLR